MPLPRMDLERLCPDCGAPIGDHRYRGEEKDPSCPRAPVPERGYLQGLLAGTVVVAEVTGKIKIADMTDQTWKVVNEIHEALLAAASAEANRLAQS